jgi:hypothetical protein
MCMMSLHVPKFLPFYSCLASYVDKHETSQIGGGLREQRACAVVDEMTSQEKGSAVHVIFRPPPCLSAHSALIVL